MSHSIYNAEQSHCTFNLKKDRSHVRTALFNTGTEIKRSLQVYTALLTEPCMCNGQKQSRHHVLQWCFIGLIRGSLARINLPFSKAYLVAKSHWEHCPHIASRKSIQLVPGKELFLRIYSGLVIKQAKMCPYSIWGQVAIELPTILWQIGVILQANPMQRSFSLYRTYMYSVIGLHINLQCSASGLHVNPIVGPPQMAS